MPSLAVLDAVIHGCPTQQSDDTMEDAIHYLTVLPHPCTHGYSLQVCPHFMLWACLQ